MSLIIYLYKCIILIGLIHAKCQIKSNADCILIFFNVYRCIRNKREKNKQKSPKQLGNGEFPLIEQMYINA